MTSPSPAAERARAQWQTSLLNGSARNPLLYYRPLSTGTLILDDADPDALADLRNGKTLGLKDSAPTTPTPQRGR